MKIKHLIALIAAVFMLASCGSNVSEVKPSRRNLTELVFASGILQAEDQYNLTAQTDGYLVKMDFKEGTNVMQGQLLAIIDNNQNVINAESASQLHVIAKAQTYASAPALLQIKANLQAATAKLKHDQQQADRYQRLLENNSVSKTEFEDAQLTLLNSKASLNALQEQYQNQQLTARQEEVTQRYASDVNQVLSKQNQVTALQSGKIYTKQKQLGDYVRKGDVIAMVGNPLLIYARLSVDETSMSKLKLGQIVQVRLNTDKKKIYEAVLHQILPSFDDTSRSFLVKAYFKDRPDLDITGTQLEANIITGTKNDALVIPASYLSYGNKVTLKEGKKVIQVYPGMVSTEWVEIINGLQEDQIIMLPQH